MVVKSTESWPRTLGGFASIGTHAPLVLFLVLATRCGSCAAMISTFSTIRAGRGSTGCMLAKWPRR